MKKGRPMNFRPSMSTCSGAAIVLASLLAATQAVAQTFPAKPIRFVIPTSPGGNADIVGRIAAEGMSRELGQNVFVDNQAGGRQVPGTLFVARANPDGY